MRRLRRTAVRGILRILLAGTALAAGTGLAAPAGQRATAEQRPERQRSEAELRASDTDARLPFLAAASAALFAPLDLPTRFAGGSAALRAARRDPLPDRAGNGVPTAIRLQRARRQHEAVARALAAARAGRPEARNTPPPYDPVFLIT